MNETDLKKKKKPKQKAVSCIAYFNMINAIRNKTKLVLLLGLQRPVSGFTMLASVVIIGKVRTEHRNKKGKVGRQILFSPFKNCALNIINRNQEIIENSIIYFKSIFKMKCNM